MGWGWGWGWGWVGVGERRAHHESLSSCLEPGPREAPPSPSYLDAQVDSERVGVVQDVIGVDAELDDGGTRKAPERRIELGARGHVDDVGHAGKGAGVDGVLCTVWCWA